MDVTSAKSVEGTALLDRMTEPRTCAIAFFHQNEVENAQGGVERYVASLLDTCGAEAVLITEEESQDQPNRITVTLRGSLILPKWVRFNIAVLANARRIRAELQRRNVKVLEFSRPEYALFSWLFRGQKVFTFHGMGPNRSQVGQRLVHDMTAMVAATESDSVQIIGRDVSALPPLVKHLVSTRTVHIDAWYDERFKCVPLPDVRTGPLICFYAGRLSEQKNPALLFAVIRESLAKLPFPVEFRYFGGDSDKIEAAGLSHVVKCAGLLSPSRLAEEMAKCHVGLLCSKEEGSPFAVIETLACGRAVVSSPIAGLMQAYADISGAFFAEGLTPDAFLTAIARAREFLLTDNSSSPVAERIAADVAHRRQNKVARAMVERLQGLADVPEVYGDRRDRLARGR